MADGRSFWSSARWCWQVRCSPWCALPTGGIIRRCSARMSPCPKHPDTLQPRLGVDEKHERSVDYRKRTELLNESAASFDRSIAIHPGNFQAWYNYGLNRALAGDTVKAVNCYRRSIELSPTYQVAMNNLAVIYDAQGRLIPPQPGIDGSLRWIPTMRSPNRTSRTPISTRDYGSARPADVLKRLRPTGKAPPVIHPILFL